MTKSQEVLTPAARDRIASLGYDPVYGARPVKRVIQRSLQNRLAEELLKGEYPEEATFEVDYQDEEFLFRRIEQSPPAQLAGC